MITKTICKLAQGPMKAKGPASREDKCQRAVPQGHSVAKGPDPSLRKGPQKSNPANKTQSKGPQKENRKGPIGRQVVRIKEQQDSFEE